MLRCGIKRFAHPVSRSYSQGTGFDISVYLSRIEAATKKTLPTYSKGQKPLQKQPSKPGQKPGVKADGKSDRKPRFFNNSNQQNKGQQSKGPRNQNQNRTFSPRTQQTNQANAEGNQKNQQRQVQQKSAASEESAAPESATEWSTLDSSSVKPPLSRGNYRSRPRTVASKAKKQFQNRSKTKSAPKRVGARPQVDNREYTPYLSPQEALGVMMRNEGTSSGGFISPFDVSLQSLQPNFVPSALTFNTRVRSVLNVASETSDREHLNQLVDEYVAGKFTNLSLNEQNRSLSGESLISHINSNRTLNLESRKFLLDVGTGKVVPKQITSHNL